MADERQTDDGAAMTCDVRGRVQGVGFRVFVYEEAQKLGLHGYVRNGRNPRQVEVVAHGPRARLEQLVAVLHKGPPLAHVESVGVIWAADAAPTPGFSIRRD